MAGLPYLPTSVLDTTNQWDWTGTVQNAMHSIQQAGASIMQPVQQHVQQAVAAAIPAPPPPPAQPPPPPPELPQIKPFSLGTLADWGMGPSRSQESGVRSQEEQPATFTLPSPSTFFVDPVRAVQSAMAPQPPGAGQRATPGPWPAPAAGAGAAAPPPAPGPIDNSSREAFVRTAYPHALEAADGDPQLARQLLATAISENGKVGTGRDLGEMGFNVGGIQGVKGTAGSFTALDAGRPREFAAYRTLGEGFRAVRDLVSGGRYAQARATYKQTGDIDRYWREVNQAGYSETPDWQDRIAQIRRTQVDPLVAGGAAPAAAPTAQAAPAFGTYTPETLTPFGVNQITQGQAEGLTTEEALAVCGPAATLAFAKANGGRMPTLREAKELGERLGVWNVNQGMAGPASEVKLLDAMGIKSRLAEGADEATIAREVAGGRPVIVDSPGHYYVATGYDPQTRQFEFGQSAGVLKKSGGRTRYRLDELSSLGMGAPRASIFMGSR